MARFCIRVRATILLLVTPLVALCQEKPKSPPSVTLDPTFGKAGMIVEQSSPVLPKHGRLRALSVDAEGRPIAIGNGSGQRTVVARYTKNGRPDKAFADGGKASITIESNETVDAAGSTELQMTYDATIDPKNRILVVGHGAGIDDSRKSDFAIMRFTSEGTLDKTFAGIGYRKYQAHDAQNVALAVAAAPDATFVVAGYAQIDRPRLMDPLLLRIRDNGDLDENFSATANGSLRWLAGESVSAIPTAVTIDNLGRYIVVMNLEIGRKSSWAVARLTKDGEVDETFGKQGLWKAALDDSATSEFAGSIILDKSGRIVLAGYSETADKVRRLAAARLTERGALDTTFGSDGTGCVVLNDYGARVTHRLGPRAALHQGRIAIIGSLEAASGNSRVFGLAVLDDDGKKIAKAAPKAFPGSKGNDQPWGVAFDNEGRIIVAGMSQAPDGIWHFALARYVVAPH